MRKKVIGIIILLLIFSGCGIADNQSETVYEVSDVVVVADYHNSIKEYDFSYMYVETESTESEYIDSYMPKEEPEKVHKMKNYKDEMNGLRKVRSARESKYGYRNCYVVDQQGNGCLYLTDEYL